MEQIEAEFIAATSAAEVDAVFYKWLAKCNNFVMGRVLEEYRDEFMWNFRTPEYRRLMASQGDGRSSLQKKGLLGAPSTSAWAVKRRAQSS